MLLFEVLMDTHNFKKEGFTFPHGFRSQFMGYWLQTRTIMVEILDGANLLGSRKYSTREKHAQKINSPKAHPADPPPPAGGVNLEEDGMFLS